jgi:hypothetical protein
MQFIPVRSRIGVRDDMDDMMNKGFAINDRPQNHCCQSTKERSQTINGCRSVPIAVARAPRKEAHHRARGSASNPQGLLTELLHACRVDANGHAYSKLHVHASFQWILMSWDKMSLRN